jgi:putative FmdB family regulatory protein
MPIYEYECMACGTTFEKRQGFHDEPKADCPNGHIETRRLIGTPAIVFKGSGFYINDSKTDKKNGSKSSTTEKDTNGTSNEPTKSEATSENKAESKTDSKAENKAESKSESKSEGKTKESSPAAD